MAEANVTKNTSRPKDVTGERFGRLVVMSIYDTVISKSGFSMTRWNCVCDCGNKRIVRRQHLVAGHTNSCGCFNKEITAKRNTKHNFSIRGQIKPEYNSWSSMITRCENPNAVKFPSYGGRGITVCQRWRESFEAFLADMGPKPSPTHSIDRIDVNGNYDPNNCRWASPKEQGMNKRSNRIVDAFGKKQCVTAWAEENGISVQVIFYRLRAGWTPERAVSAKTR